MSNRLFPESSRENKRDQFCEVYSNLVRREPVMQRSLMTLPSLSRHLAFIGLKNVPTRAHAATITSLRLNKQELPKQPIPDLKSTAEKYLKSVKPLLDDQEYYNTEKIVNEFISNNGPGPKLHNKLLERFEQTENWMSEWWLNESYLGYRSPVIVNSSPGTVGPPQKFNSPDDMYIFAARLVSAVCDYDHIVKSGNMKQELVRKDPLDMQPYGMILGTHRRPSKNYDQLLHTDDSKHIIIMNNNHLFKLDVISNTGKAVSEGQIAASIKDLVERSATEAPPIGILTGNCRDAWTEDHSQLKATSSNAIVLEDIERSLFVLCLDKEIPKNKFQGKNNESTRAVQCLTGFSSDTNAGNRWHDKIVQYIVSRDGFVGMEYEHSPCEGVPVAVLHDHVLKYIASKDDKPCEEAKDFPKAQSLKFEISEAMENAINTAKSKVDEIAAGIDMECFAFEDFGSDEIKKAKMSPDSFIQMAMQLAYYRLHGKPCAHYESAGLRRFYSARTECIRSTSVESVAFSRAMTNDAASKEEKKEAMLKAVNAHKKIAGEAAMGQGVDRHLFGMRMIAKAENIEVPAIYKDVGFTRSTHFNISSSQVPYRTASFMCYGPVVPDGYGCCYNPRPNDIRIACSSFNACEETSSKKFANALKQAMRDMKELSGSC